MGSPTRAEFPVRSAPRFSPLFEDFLSARPTSRLPGHFYPSTFSAKESHRELDTRVLVPKYLVPLPRTRPVMSIPPACAGNLTRPNPPAAREVMNPLVQRREGPPIRPTVAC